MRVLPKSCPGVSSFAPLIARERPAGNSAGRTDCSTVGTSDSHTRRVLPLLGLGDRFHRVYVAFVSNPDKSPAAIPSHEQIRRHGTSSNAELVEGFETMSWSDWLQRHAAVSEEDFAKMLRAISFSILLSAPTSILSPWPGGARTPMI